MPTLKFTQFLKNYGIKLLPVSNESIVPGSVMERRKKGFYSIGSLRDVMGGTASEWATRVEEANMVAQTVSRDLSLKGKASMSEFGVNIDSGLTHAKAVKFTLSNVQGRVFVRQSKLKLVSRIHALRKTNKKAWKELNGNCIADFTYYASEVKIEFDVEGNIDLKAEVKNSIKLGGDANIRWRTKKSFVVSNNIAVPFGFSGWVV